MPTIMPNVTTEIDHMAEIMRNRHQHANRVRQSMKIDPAILDDIIRHIMRTDDKDKIMVRISEMVKFNVQIIFNFKCNV